MKKISRERFEWLKEQHWKLWDWLAENPGKYKSEWEGFELLGYFPICKCFACEFGYEVSERLNCKHCPLGADNIGCFNGGVFRKWVDLTEWIRRNKSSALAPECKRDVSYLAKQIRDLPWSEEYVEDKVMSENYIVINGNKTELTKEQMEQLGIGKKLPKRWRAEYEEWYWYVDNRGNPRKSIDTYGAGHTYHYRIHNYFKTEEEAKKYARVLDTELKLREFAEAQNTEPIDWENDHKAKWIITYNYFTDRIVTDWSWNYYSGRDIYFTSEDIAKQAITEIGEDNVKEYLTYEW